MVVTTQMDTSWLDGSLSELPLSVGCWKQSRELPTGLRPTDPPTPPTHRPTDPPTHRPTDPPTHRPTDPPTRRAAELPSYQATTNRAGSTYPALLLPASPPPCLNTSLSVYLLTYPPIYRSLPSYRPAQPTGWPNHVPACRPAQLAGCMVLRLHAEYASCRVCFWDAV